MLVVGRCILTAIKDGGKIQTNQITIMKGETQDDVERFQEYGFTSVPLPGCEAIAVFVGGNRESASVIATDDRRHRLKGLSPGDVALYTSGGSFIKLAATGLITVETTGNVEVKAGTIKLGNGATEAAVLGDLFKATFDAHTHVGNLGYTTSPPSTPMPPTNLSTVVKVK